MISIPKFGALPKTSGPKLGQFVAVSDLLVNLQTNTRWRYQKSEN